MNIIFSLIQHVQTWKSWEKGLLWAAVFIHLATAGIAISRRAWLTDDSIQYLLIADHIQQGNLSQTYAGEVLPDTQRTPGYPFFLILTGGIPWVILGLQHLLCFLSGYFIYKISKPETGSLIARRLALFWMIQPYPLWISSLLLSESVFIFLALASLYFFAKAIRNGGWIFLLSSFFLAAISTWVKPVGIVLGTGMVIFLLFQGIRQKMSLKFLPLAALVFGIVLFPLIFRNWQLTGRPSLSSMAEMGIVHGRLGGIEAFRKGDGIADEAVILAGDSILSSRNGIASIRNYPENGQTHEANLFPKGGGGLLWEEMSRFPFMTAKFHVKTLLQLLEGQGYGWANYVSGNSRVALVSACIQSLFSILFLFGLGWGIWRFRKLPPVAAFGIVVWIIFIAASSLSWADGRYRMAADPFLFPLIGILFSKMKKREISVEDKRNPV